MKQLLKKLFGLSGSQKSDPSSLPGSRSWSSSVQDGSENATRGQLVQVMMRDVLRKSGIPPGWIECQIQVVASRSRGPGIYVRLVVKHWDSRLMQYTFAFQKALLTAIVQFEPNASNWLHGISWQLEVASTCPHTILPDKGYWLETPQSVPVAAPAQAPSTAFKPVPAKPALPLFEIEKPTPENDATADLERLFAIRDNELAHQAANNLMPAGYEKTEPAPL